jgi:hypothetical protein
MARHQGHWFFFYAGLLVRTTALILSIVILILNTTMRLDLDWIAVSYIPNYTSPPQEVLVRRAVICEESMLITK